MSKLRSALLIVVAAIVAVMAGQVLAAPAGAAEEGPQTVVVSVRPDSTR